MIPKPLGKSLRNLSRHLSLGLSLGLNDIRQAYRRSALGPFWITIGMGVQVLAIGLVFGVIFNSPMNEFLPFLAASLIIWAFISSSITEGGAAFINGEGVIRQISLPFYLHLIRTIGKNVLMLGHNSIILPVVFIFFLRAPNVNLLLVIPGLILTILFLTAISYPIGLATTRFRDLQQILASIMTVAFYVTPVIWQPSLIPPGIAHLLLGLNPLYHFLQIIRLPLLGQAPTFENWMLAISLTLAASVLAYWSAKKYKNRLAYWV